MPQSYDSKEILNLTTIFTRKIGEGANGIAAKFAISIV